LGKTQSPTYNKAYLTFPLGLFISAPGGERTGARAETKDFRGRSGVVKSHDLMFTPVIKEVL